MRYLAAALIGFSALGFVLAVAAPYVGGITGVAPEGFSRACTNLALIAIALGVWFRDSGNQKSRL